VFNWLYARSTGGEFIVRIEDTDQQRLVPGAVDTILESLQWLGLDWDEGPDLFGGQFGPYYQSQRTPLYTVIKDLLITQGKAYECYCSPERLQQMRQQQQQVKSRVGYDGRCRDLSLAQQETAAALTTPVVRFRMPDEGTTTCTDYIRGNIVFDNSLIDDFVIMKSDGYPTYHFASVIDDHAMEISHVMRADEWLSSLPRHLHLYKALGYSLPTFVHLPIILGPDRSKLSKRHGATSILAYRDDGFLPDAILNFLALLGWSLDDSSEVFSRDQLIDSFTIDRVGDSAAVFDIDKLSWMNGVYIRSLSDIALAKEIEPFLDVSTNLASTNTSQPSLIDIVPVIKERIKTLADADDMISFFGDQKLEYDPNLLIPKGLDTTDVTTILDTVYPILEQTKDFVTNTLETVLRTHADELKLKPGQVFSVLRVALTGRTVAPPLFETMEILGKTQSLNRLRTAKTLMENKQ
jgi:glutamyl-tRNA synthetase